jgi:hypothetical protein
LVGFDGQRARLILVWHVVLRAIWLREVGAGHVEGF